MAKLFSLVLLLIYGLTGISIGQESIRLKGPSSGIKPEISTTRTSFYTAPRGQIKERPRLYQTSASEMQRIRSSDIASNVTLGGANNGPGAIYAPATGTSFDATVQNGWVPYDAAIAVGPNHIVLCTNAQIEVYDRSGNFLARYSTDPASGADFFPTDAGVSFDPKVFYDKVANRFVINYAQAEGTLAFMNVAVSVTSDPTGPWYKYHLDWTLDGTTQTNNWGDYPSLGYDNNAVYIGANQYSFDNSYQYSKIRVLSKSQLYSGAPATWTDFVNLRNLNGTSAFTVKAGRMLSSSNSEYLMNTVSTAGSFVTLWRIDNAPASPTLTRVATVPVNFYTAPPPIRQPNNVVLDKLDCRTQDLVMQNGVLYEAFSERYGNTLRSRGAGIRYLEITTSGQKLADISYFNVGVDQFYPAVTPDPAGNVFMVFSRSSTTEYPSMYQTGMRTTETVFEAPALVRAGTGIATYQRWGDYSGIANDFTVTDAVWEFSGWTQPNGAWATHVVSASFGAAPKILPESALNDVVYTFALNANYPNPFNPSTVINYQIPVNSYVSLKIYDALGQEVASLVNERQEAGIHNVTFNAANLSSGIYIYTLRAGSFSATRKLMLVK